MLTMKKWVQGKELTPCARRVWREQLSPAPNADQETFEWRPGIPKAGFLGLKRGPACSRLVYLSEGNVTPR